MKKRLMNTLFVLSLVPMGTMSLRAQDSVYGNLVNAINTFSKEFERLDLASGLQKLKDFAANHKNAFDSENVALIVTLIKQKLENVPQQIKEAIASGKMSKDAVVNLIDNVQQQLADPSQLVEMLHSRIGVLKAGLKDVGDLVVSLKEAGISLPVDVSFNDIINSLQRVNVDALAQSAKNLLEAHRQQVAAIAQHVAQYLNALKEKIQSLPGSTIDAQQYAVLAALAKEKIEAIAPQIQAFVVQNQEGIKNLINTVHSQIPADVKVRILEIIEQLKQALPAIKSLS